MQKNVRRARPGAADDGALPVEDVLGVLDEAAAEHVEWLLDWSRAISCKQQPPPSVAAENAALLSTFGHWYDRHADDPLVDQPAFRALAAAHSAMHEHGAWLVRKGWRDASIPRAEFDAFADKVRAFHERLQRLERAFRRAEVELDALTGIHNRRSVEREIKREQARAERNGRPLTLALADLDHFKRVNDEHGHAVGDEVLAVAAGTFGQGVRPYDHVFRFGGEEFLICLPDADIVTACQIVGRLRKTLERTPIELRSGATLHVTASFGLAAAEGGVSLAETIERADAALYAAKKAGRNRIHVWDEETME